MDGRLLEHAVQPRNLGVLPQPDGYALHTGICGDALELYLSIKQGRIKNAVFIPHGCAVTQACGSVLTVMAPGLSLEEALDMPPERVADALGGLPPDHIHCAELAVGALREAIQDYFAKERNGWKKLYS